MDNNSYFVDRPSLDDGHRDDIKRAATNMLGERRRLFQAEMALKYCGGIPRQAETLFGWSRQTVQLGLHEKRSGIICLGAQAAFCGDKLWEEKHPDVAEALWHFIKNRHTVSPVRRLTAKAAIQQLRSQGFDDEVLPSMSTMAEVLNRNGYHLRSGGRKKTQRSL